jgi:inorganic pyrophosphatase
LVSLLSITRRPPTNPAGFCKAGAATDMIDGIVLWFKSVIIPVIVLALFVYFSFATCDMYGVAIAAIGFLSMDQSAIMLEV